MSTEPSHRDLLALTVKIVSAHVSNNQVLSENIPPMMANVYKSLSTIGVQAAPVDRPVPAVPVRNSITPDYIVCLEDGRRLKMLKRHLQTACGLTPEEYRERWGLAPDYPMVAPNYARRRSELAKRIGLGRHGRGDS
jgi:predicted transcriptional regulator